MMKRSLSLMLIALMLLSGAAMAAPNEALDAPLVCAAARLVSTFPGWVLIMLVLMWQWRSLREVTVLRVPVRIPLTLLSLAGMALAMGVSLAPPKWLLPTRWSDFAHWRMMLEAVGGRLTGYLRAAHSPLNSQDLYACLRVSAQGILAALLLIDIRGGQSNEQKMDRADTRNSAVSIKRRGESRGAGGSGASGTKGAVRGAGV